MGRALLAVGTALVLCFAGLGAVVYFTRDEDGIAVDAILAESFTRAVEEGDRDRQPVVLADVTRFQWDQVLIFAPGTPRDQVSRELGFRFNGEMPYIAQSREMLVFTKGGRFVRFADYRGSARFDGLERFQRLTPEQAVWQVRDLVATLRRPA